MGKVKEAGEVFTILRRNEVADTKLALISRAIGSAQLLRDKLIAAAEAERADRIAINERRAHEAADELATLMGALKEFH